MNNIKYVQLEPAAFLTDIEFQMMDAEQRGVYCSVIFYLYCNGGQLELGGNSDITLLENNCSKISIISGCQKTGPEWAAIWSKIAHKFQMTGNIITHKRVTEELKRAENYRINKSEAGKKGMQKRWAGNSDITKVSKVKVSKVNNTNQECNDAFEDFWEAYPKKKSKGQARTTWAKLKKAGKLPELAILQDAIAVAKTSHDWQRDNGQYILNPSTWLNAEGWKDVIEKGGQPGSSPKCFVCKGPTKSKLHNRSNVHICDCCKQLLDKAPNFTTRQGKTIPKHKLLLSQLEEMILKEKTKDRD